MLKIFFALLMLGASICFGQNHVTWELGFDYERSTIQVKGEIEEGWHLYSLLTPLDAGPIPVEINTKKSSFQIRLDEAMKARQNKNKK